MCIEESMILVATSNSPPHAKSWTEISLLVRKRLSHLEDLSETNDHYSR
jgi:hypothetical protein